MASLEFKLSAVTLFLLLPIELFSSLPSSLACPNCPYPTPRHKPPPHVEPPPYVKPPPHVMPPWPPIFRPPPLVMPPIPPLFKPPPFVMPPMPPFFKPPPFVMPPMPPFFKPPPFVMPPMPPFFKPPPFVEPPMPWSPNGRLPCRSPPPPPSAKTCPVDAMKLGACVDLVGGSAHTGIGKEAKATCCPLLQGLADLDAALCLCTIVRAKQSNANAVLPIVWELLIGCGKYPPPGYQCPAHA